MYVTLICIEPVDPCRRLISGVKALNTHLGHSESSSKHTLCADKRDWGPGLDDLDAAEDDRVMVEKYSLGSHELLVDRYSSRRVENWVRITMQGRSICIILLLTAAVERESLAMLSHDDGHRWPKRVGNKYPVLSRKHGVVRGVNSEQSNPAHIHAPHGP